MDPEGDAPDATYRKRSHAWIDARSLEMARCVAKKLCCDPSLIEKARRNLQRWKGSTGGLPKALREWEEILSLSSAEEVLELLVEEGEEGRRRRQSSPFTGILSAEERRGILEKYEKIGA